MTKILLVEDDKSLREIYGVRLLAEGYQIASAGDGEEALAMAVKERPDLIISDVMMPKISGFDMLDILRSTPETKEIKVIMMTALSSEDQRARGESLGANRYLVKSQVGIEDVVRTVHDVLADAPIANTPTAQIFNTPAPAVVSATPVTPRPFAMPPARPVVLTAPATSAGQTNTIASPIVPPRTMVTPIPTPEFQNPVAPQPVVTQIPVTAPAYQPAPAAPAPAPTQLNTIPVFQNQMPQPTAPFSTPMNPATFQQAAPVAMAAPTMETVPAPAAVPQNTDLAAQIAQELGIMQQEPPTQQF